MTRHELASFGLRLLGIYALIEWLALFQHVGGLVYLLTSDRTELAVDFREAAVMLVPLLLMTMVGVLLIVFSRDLAPLLVGEDKPLGLSTTVTGRDVQAIGFSVVAVLVFLRSIPQIGQAAWAYYYYSSLRGGAGSATDRSLQSVWRYGLPGVIQLVLAVILFLQARGLAGLWHRIRIGRYAKIEEMDASADQQDRDVS